MPGKPIKYVIVSHHHFDHFHYPSMRRVDKGARVLVPRFGVEGARLWQLARADDLRVVEARLGDHERAVAALRAGCNRGGLAVDGLKLDPVRGEGGAVMAVDQFWKRYFAGTGQQTSRTTGRCTA